MRNAALHPDGKPATGGYPSGAYPAPFTRCDRNRPLLRTVIVDEGGRLCVESTGSDGAGFLIAFLNSDGWLLGEGPMPDRRARIAA